MLFRGRMKLNTIHNPFEQSSYLLESFLSDLRKKEVSREQEIEVSDRMSCRARIRSSALAPLTYKVPMKTIALAIPPITTGNHFPGRVNCSIPNATTEHK